MKTPFIFSIKNKLAARIIAIAIIFSVTVPNVFAVSVSLALADEGKAGAESSAPTSSGDSKSESTSSDSSKSSDTSESSSSSKESSSDSEASKPAESKGASNEPTESTSPEVTSGSSTKTTDTKVDLEKTEVTTETVSTTKSSGKSVDLSNTSDFDDLDELEAPRAASALNAAPMTGSITVCNVLVDENGVIATSSASNLPPAQFGIQIYQRSVSPPAYVRNATFNTETFAVSNPALSPLPAQCVKFDNLPLGGYIYSKETITGEGASYWVTPRYNDQVNTPADSLSDFWHYTDQLFDNDPSNDELRNDNADGIITITDSVNRRNRVLVVLNQHNAYTPPVVVPPNCANGTSLTSEEFQTAYNNGLISFDLLPVTNGVSTTSTFNFTNNTGCTAPISFASYKVFFPGEEGTSTSYFLSRQVLFDRVGIVNATSSTSMTVRLPSCMAQVDAWFGLAPQNLLDSNPYSYPNVPRVLAYQFYFPTANAWDDLPASYCDENTGGNTPPVITLIGENPITLTVGNTFTDPGATAFDNEEGNLPVTATGTVDANTVGDYEILYSASDSEGLTATISRTIKIVAGDNGGGGNTPPTITLVGDNPLTITIGSTFTDPGATANDAEDGDLTSSVKNEGVVDVNTEGSYEIRYIVEDSEGLTASTSRTVKVVSGGNGGPTNPTNGGGGGRGGGSIAGGKRTVPAGEVLGASIEPGECEYLRDYLRIDLNNNPVEVLKLQLFLKNLEGFSDLEVTGTFDTATFDAVSRFQEKYSGDILIPWGYEENMPTGYVYILTKKKVNEIFCNKAFPLTTLQEQEISDFRNLIAGLDAANISVMTADGATGNGIKDIKTIKDTMSNMVGSIDSTSTEVAGTSGKMAKIDPKNIRAVAAAIFSIPDNREEILQSLYFLLIGLIAIYLLVEIAVSSRDTSTLSKYQVWSRKATGYIIGLVIAVIIAIWYQVYSIVVPFLVLAIASGVFLAWSMSKGKTDSVINLPPTKN